MRICTTPQLYIRYSFVVQSNYHCQPTKVYIFYRSLYLFYAVSVLFLSFHPHSSSCTVSLANIHALSLSLFHTQTHTSMHFLSISHIHKRTHSLADPLTVCPCLNQPGVILNIIWLWETLCLIFEFCVHSHSSVLVYFCFNIYFAFCLFKHAFPLLRNVFRSSISVFGMSIF